MTQEKMASARMQLTAIELTIVRFQAGESGCPIAELHRWVEIVGISRKNLCLNEGGVNDGRGRYK